MGSVVETRPPVETNVRLKSCETAPFIIKGGREVKE